MNVSQANHTPQQNHSSESTQSLPEITGAGAFLSQLTLAEQGPEWFTKVDGKKIEKERINEKQQAEWRETEDLEDDLMVSLSNQGYVDRLKQTETRETARVITDSQNRDRLMQHVEKKHLHTPAVAADGEVNQAETRFSKLMSGEKDGTQSTLPKDTAFVAPKQESTDLLGHLRSSQQKTTDLTADEMLQRLDANLSRGMKQATSSKASTDALEKNAAVLTKPNSLDAANRNASRNTTARTISMAGLTENAVEGRKGEPLFKAESQTSKTATTVNMKDVVDTVRIMISSKTNEMVIRLAPEHLGKLEIRLRKIGEKLNGRFGVDNQQAREAIETQLPQLKSELAEQGIHIEEFIVYVKGDESGNPSFASQQQHDDSSDSTAQNDSNRQETASESHALGSGDGKSAAGDSGLNIYA